MRLPPQTRSQEAPEQELAARHRQTVQRPPGHHERHHAGCLLDDRVDAQPVPCAAPHRHRDAVGECDARGPEPERDPEPTRRRVADERCAGRELMRERQREPEIGVQVNRPPRLVRHPAPRGSVGRDPRQGKEREAGGRREDTGQAHQQTPRFGRHARPGALPVSDGDQDAVGGDQHERPRGEPPVQADEAVLSEGPLEHRDAGGEQDGDEHGVRADEPRQASREGQCPAGCREASGGLGTDREGKDGPQAQTAQGGEQVDRPGPGPWCAPGGSRWCARRCARGAGRGDHATDRAETR